MCQIVKIGSSIGSNYDGYGQLADLYHRLCLCQAPCVEIDFSANHWFEANLCAVLGAIALMMEQRRGMQLMYSGMSSQLENILRRNGFIGDSRQGQLHSVYDTVVSFRQFRQDEDVDFNKYILEELLSKQDFPKHSTLLGKKISESIFEIFENARTHGKCGHIHTCGQYYPRKKPARLDITIVDMGQTIHKNVNDFLYPAQYDACQAIGWAMQYGNSTKQGRTGGLGLSLIREFIHLNKGRLQLISSDGFWEYSPKEVRALKLNKSFPGTIVNIEFNFDDSCFYQLKSETTLTIDDIF